MGSRWKGDSGEVKRSSEKDSTGTSFNERNKSNTLNLDDLIHYLEYGKYSGGQAARADIEQEEYWATLLRHLLMDDVVSNLCPIYENRKVIGITFHCNNCSFRGEIKSVHNEFKVGNQDSYEITQHCKCGMTKVREGDVLEYLEHIIKMWNKSIGDKP